jgi:hypothetical protein
MAVADGAGNLKRLPGTVLVATGAIKPAGMFAVWQVSQVVVLGICEPTPELLDEGIGMMLLVPKKLREVPLVP